MPAKTPSGGGGRGAGGFPRGSGKGVVRKATRATKKAAKQEQKFIDKSVKSVTKTVSRVPKMRKHPSGYFIDSVDGAVYDRNLNLIKAATKPNVARARIKMVKNSPAAKDLKKVTNKVKTTARSLKKRPR